MQTFIDLNLLDRLRVGPLASYLDACLKRIEHEGFMPSSVPMQMYAIARFSNWLHASQLDLHQMDEATVERFLERDPGVVRGGESAPLRRPLAMLREIDVTPAKPPEPRNCQQRFLDEYRRYLLRERGLAETSLLNYVPFAEQLLSNHFGQSDMNFQELTATDITKFVQDRAHQLKPWPCQVARNGSWIFPALFAASGRDLSGLGGMRASGSGLVLVQCAEVPACWHSPTGSRSLRA